MKKRWLVLFILSLTISRFSFGAGLGAKQHGDFVDGTPALADEVNDQFNDLYDWGQQITSTPVGISDTQTLTNKTLTSPVLTTPQINDTSKTHQYIFAPNELTADRTVTLPLLTGNDDFVFEDHPQTLTNKTLTSPTIDGAVSFFPSITVSEIYIGRGGGVISTNAVVGRDALQANTTGQFNSAFGRQSLLVNTTGTSNSSFGESSLASNTTGNDNSAFGVAAGFGVTTGSNNVFIGQNSGTASSPATITTESNRIVIGDSNVTNAYIAVAWTVTSDERDKSDVIDLDHGLDFINKLRPISFKWDNRLRYKNQEKNGSMKDEKISVGFLAQEVAEVEKDLLFPNDIVADTEQQNLIKIKETAIIPYLVKAIQEQQKQIDFLNTKLNYYDNN